MKETKIWEEEIQIPTYGIGKPDKNPIFLENRVYQGSSGKIYPYPTIEKIYDEKENKTYQAVWLENEYIRVMILPELGGRIQRAYDKTNGYDFVYYNEVIKPALVGLCGPWISGGIEFNWPQHHRPTTFSPVDHMICENPDGSVTCKIHDVDQMYGSEVMSSFTLYPGKAYIEIKSNLYNRTATPQTFLWWANPAVPVNDHTQSIFPPDVHAVMDHGKRDVSRFPIATGVYYKHDYSAGVDISRYKNIPVPTSYMAEKSEFDFVGGYDYQLEAGILHIADHHVSPGKKQWTWGCGEFGKAWDRNLTDENGPYIELMTGMFTDNQPDFSWLKPMEEKSFTQFFLPYKAVGSVKNATIHACLNLEKREDGIYLCVYATQKYPEAKIVVRYEQEDIFIKNIAISPEKPFETLISFHAEDDTRLHAELQSDGKVLVAYTPLEKEISKMPEPAQPALKPEEIMTNEELYLTGLHIEQYRHATYRPDPYYLEGLKRDPGDIRINNAYGMLLLRRGSFETAESHFRTAVRRATWKNPNPYNSECYYDLGLALFYQGKTQEAYDAFYKASWSDEQQEMSFYYLAAIASSRKEYEEALVLCEKGISRNTSNRKARALRVYLLRKLTRNEEAAACISSNLVENPFDYVSRMENSYLNLENREAIRRELNGIARNFCETYLNMARDYAEWGAYEEAAETLLLCSEQHPMLCYYHAYYLMKQGKNSINVIQEAETRSSDYVFPNKLEDIAVLKYALSENPSGGMAAYYLGNLYYDRLQYKDAAHLWEKAARAEPKFPIVWRNLALAYYNKLERPEEAREAMEKAWKLAPEDARIFLELDQLYKKLGMSAENRLSRYEENQEIFMQRDDLIVEYVTLHNLLGHYEKAYGIITSHHFHPWEGGEGKVTTQYTVSLVEMARACIRKQEYQEAETYLKKALEYPDNLGEGKLEGCKDNHINYYLGVCEEKLGNQEAARSYYEMAGVGTDEPAGMMYYNDQPADMIFYQGLAKEMLGKNVEANSRFYKLLDYGETHLYDQMKVEYFAVSLPDFLIFNDDLDRRNRAHCQYLMGLAHLGLKHFKEAETAFQAALAEDPFHQNAMRYLNMCKS